MKIAFADACFIAKYDKTGAIIRDGDRKRAPFLVLGLAPWYVTIFLFLEQICAIAYGTRAYMLRGFFADVAQGKWHPRFTKLMLFGPQLNTFMSVGIWLKHFRRKLLQQWSKTMSNLGMSRFITDQVVFRCFFYKNFTSLHSKFHIWKRLTAFP